MDRPPGTIGVDSSAQTDAETRAFAEEGVGAMLSRYKIYRGKRPPGEPLPRGVRQDTRRHTRHVLRPDARAVSAYLDDPRDANWRAFEKSYVATLESRFKTDRDSFDNLAKLAEDTDVYIGCSCPTKRNPDPAYCHTMLALGFMKKKYPQLTVKFP